MRLLESVVYQPINRLLQRKPTLSRENELFVEPVERSARSIRSKNSRAKLQASNWSDSFSSNTSARSSSCDSSRTFPGQG